MAAATEITSTSQAPRPHDITTARSHKSSCPLPVTSKKQPKKCHHSTKRTPNSAPSTIPSLIVQSYINNSSVPVGGDDPNYGAAAAVVVDSDLTNRYRRLSISENEAEKEGNGNESPTRVMDGSDVDRMALPKSISVRSTELWKETMAQSQVQGNSAITVVKDRARAGCSSSAGKQKVYVRGGKKEEALVELEVYNQGMFKIKLRNEWQETGTCP